MSVIQLPLRTDLTHYDFTIPLDGVLYSFEFRWNAREEAWYFDLRDQDDNDIMNGVKVVLGWYLGARSRHDSKFPGVLQAIDSAKSNVDAGVSDLGGRVQVFYFSASEVAKI